MRVVPDKAIKAKITQYKEDQELDMMLHDLIRLRRAAKMAYAHMLCGMTSEYSGLSELGEAAMQACCDWSQCEERPKVLRLRQESHSHRQPVWLCVPHDEQGDVKGLWIPKDKDGLPKWAYGRTP